jgi:hypothetical protein
MLSLLWGSDHRTDRGSRSKTVDAGKRPWGHLDHHGSRNRGIHSRDIPGSAGWLVPSGTNSRLYHVDRRCDLVVDSLSADPGPAC